MSAGVRRFSALRLNWPLVFRNEDEWLILKALYERFMIMKTHGLVAGDARVC